jgi:transcriptional regulator with XRE-family HTH domain
MIRWTVRRGIPEVRAMAFCESPWALGGERMVDVKAWVGRDIRAARKTKGLSQFRLAERSGLSADFIGKVERGTTSPSLESLQAIADALHLPLCDLFEEDPGVGQGQEALMELVQLCRGRAKEDVELFVGIAQLVFQRRRDRSRKP